MISYTKEISAVLSFFLFMVILSLSAGPAAGQTPLTLRQSIDSALKNHPQIRSASGSRKAAESRVVQAASPYYPQIQASTGYSENHAQSPFGDSVTKGYSATLSANQLLYDFGRTGGSREAAAVGLQSAEQDETRVVHETVLNVKQSYFGLLQSQKLVHIARKTLEQSEAHLKQAQAFFNAGSKPRFDVTRAEVEVNSAKLGLLNAQNTLRLSSISLNNAMGIEPSTPLAIEEIPTTVSVPVPTLEAAQAEALGTRPDMRKADADVRAAQARVRSAEGGYFPNLSASGSYTWSDGTAEYGTFPKEDLGNSWNAAITLSLPLFEGGVTRGRVGEAQANRIIAEAQRDSLKQTILFDVNQTYASYENAAARVEVMESSLKKARENLDIAQGRYQAGVGPYIEVTDAQVSAVKAETDFLQAQYDVQVAVAKLQKAIGVMTME